MHETLKKKSPISAFGSAVASRSVTIEIEAAELSILRPDWPEAKSADFLEQNGPRIAAAALRAAWNEIVGLMEVDPGEVRHGR